MADSLEAAGIWLIKENFRDNRPPLHNNWIYVQYMSYAMGHNGYQGILG